MQKSQLDPELQYTLDEMLKRLQPILGDNLLAFYLQGSFALGGGDAASDVDFLVVVEDDIPDEVLPELEAMHRSLFEIPGYWSQHLEGSYITRALLKKEDPQRRPIVYIDNGSRDLERSNHDNDLVVRWVTREHGIVLYGADPKTYIDPIPVSDLKRDAKNTMHTWGQQIIRGDYILDAVWVQVFAVILYCRILHTLATGAVHAKPASIEWSLMTLDEQWHDLIREAWQKRYNKYADITAAADADDVAKTVEFIAYALELSETY